MTATELIDGDHHVVPWACVIDWSFETLCVLRPEGSVGAWISAPTERPGTHRVEDETDEQPGARQWMRDPGAATDAPHRGRKERDGECGEDVSRRHGASRHCREQPLLPPRRRTRVEQRRAGLEQAQVVRGEDPLTLVAVLKHVDAMLPRYRFAHKVALA